jgi:hypothetical protein
MLHSQVITKSYAHRKYILNCCLIYIHYVTTNLSLDLRCIYVRHFTRFSLFICYRPVFIPKDTAGLCPWDNRGKANSWRPPAPLHKNLQQKNAKLWNIVTAISLLN